MSTFYGSDSNCLSDVGLFDLQITDPNILIGQRIIRLLQTSRGGLGAVGDDSDRGWDCRQYINMKLTPALIAQACQQIAFECQKDEEVDSASVSFSLDPTTLQLSAITINITASSGPFTLVGNVSTITSDLVFSFQ
jgi:hypothetical protein